MGHYYAEMACQRCGRIDCTCPPRPDPDKFKWINDLDEDFTPIRVCDFDAKHKMGILYRLHKPKFDTEQEAWAHSKTMLKDHIVHLEALVDSTKAKIKDVKAKLRKRK